MKGAGEGSRTERQGHRCQERGVEGGRGALGAQTEEQGWRGEPSRGPGTEGSRPGEQQPAGAGRRQAQGHNMVSEPTAPWLHQATRAQRSVVTGQAGNDLVSRLAQHTRLWLEPNTSKVDGKTDGELGPRPGN